MGKLRRALLFLKDITHFEEEGMVVGTISEHIFEILGNPDVSAMCSHVEEGFGWSQMDIF